MSAQILRTLAALALLAAVAPSGARAVRKYRVGKWRQELALAEKAIRNGDENVTVVQRRPDADDDEDERNGDDANARRLADLAYHGVRGPEYQRHLLEVAAHEARLQSHAAVTGQSWVNIGPADARFEYNGGNYTANDSGRPNSIRVDPRNAAVVYLATSGGGIWKTYDYGVAGGPHWVAITENVGNLAIGALDLDPRAPDTLWAGLGDFVDTPGGQLIRSTDGGATWGPPITLSGHYPAAVEGALGAAIAHTIRDVRVSPADSNLVMVATDVGLFRSTNATSASPTFSLVDLPNGATDLEESAWTFAYLGGTQWLVSGAQACDPGAAPLAPGGGVPAGTAACGGTAICNHGNLGDIWKSTDAGATWTSLRAAGTLGSFISAAGEVGRIALAAGDPSNPASTVVYGEAGNADECNNPALAGILKSTNGGQTFSAAATSSTAPVNTTSDCGDMNITGGQSWYNLAIAVDPGNSQQVITGGNLCGAISKDGGSTWINIGHWLPGSGGGTTSSGALPYIHADWHTATISRVGGTLAVFAGTDGGLFSSSNVFNATGSTAQSVTWTSLNKGLTTHLCYSVASGDPADGNADTVLTGLQDNGTRLRDSGTGNLPTTFNQVNGGDGFGAAASSNAGANFILWSSVYSSNGHRIYCKPGNCNVGGAFSQKNPTLPSGDAEPFITRFAPVQNDANSAVLSATTYNVYKANFTPAWTRMTSTSLANSVRNLAASPATYTIGGVSARLYGVAQAGGNFAVITDKSGAFTVTLSTKPLGTGTYAANTALFLRGTSSITFPKNALNFGAGKIDGKVFLGATVTPVLSDNVTPVPDTVGHLFLTTDGGSTWTSLRGDGSGGVLPNVGVEVVRFDPGDTTDQTIYAGTDVGLYRSADQGKTWSRYGVGLPMVRVSDLFIGKASGILRVSTYGRGLWEIYPNATLKGVDGDGDWDRNLAIDGIDLAALASRMGATPAGTTAPLYDFHSDLTGTTSAIDDNDLTALLAKFGQHP